MKKKTSKHGIFDSKRRCWLLQIKRINKVIHKNKTLLKHDDATNPRRRERARLSNWFKSKNENYKYLSKYIFLLIPGLFLIKMFLHYIIDIYHMQDRRTKFTAIMINICFLLFTPWRTFAYGTFIFMWPWKEADHRSKYISRVILTFFVEY